MLRFSLIVSFVLLFITQLFTFHNSGAHAQVQDLKALHGQVKKHMRRGKYAEAEKAARKAVAIVRRRFGRNHRHYATAINTLGMVYRRLSRNKKALDLHTKALRIRERHYGRNHAVLVSVLKNMGRASFKLGRYDKALLHQKRARKILFNRFEKYHVSVASIESDIARTYMKQGELARAEKLLDKALHINQRHYSNRDTRVQIVKAQLAEVYEQQGRPEDAITLYTEVLNIDKRRLGAEHPAVARMLGNIGRVYLRQNKVDDAIPFIERTIKIFEKKQPARAIPLSTSLLNLANAYQRKGRYAESLPLLQKSLAIMEKHYGKEHINLAPVLVNLARAYRKLKFKNESVRFRDRSIKIKKKVLGENHPSYAESLRKLAINYDLDGRRKEAGKLFRKSLKIQKERLGDTHPSTIQTLGSVAHFTYRKKQYKKSFIYALDALNAIRKRETMLGDNPLLGTDKGVFNKTYYTFLRTAHAYSWQEQEKGRLALNAAFKSSQNFNASVTAAVIPKMAARLSVKGKEIQSLIRRRQDIALLWKKTKKALDKILTRPETVKSRLEEKTLKRKLGNLEKETDRITARLGKKAPKYQQLTRPQALNTSEVRELLNKDEVLIKYAIFERDLFIWAISSSDVGWYRVPINKNDLVSRIKKMRISLDINEVEKTKKVFELDNAHQLYEKLLAPLEDVILPRKKLIIIPSGPLVSLPFQVLITAKPLNNIPKKVSDYKHADWLVKEHAISTLPSVSSLQALRNLPEGARAEEPFIGYGDPIFKDPTKKRFVVKRTGSFKGTRSLSDFYNEDGVDLELLGRVLQPLPETREELNTVAKFLGASEDMVITGSQATEQAIRTSRLDYYRVIYFATHGMVAGDFKKIGSHFTEPALVMTLPFVKTSFDDGLLTASEIAALKLNADWVILSACNTALNGEPVSESLSALAKAFLYAGSRALLVSHWPVVSESAKKLTIGMFKELRQSKNLDKAEALRRSMIAQMNDPTDEHNAYPGSWAPFVIIGDGR